MTKWAARWTTSVSSPRRSRPCILAGSSVLRAALGRLSLAIVALALLLGCAHATAGGKTGIEGGRPDTSLATGTLRLIGYESGFGQGCPLQGEPPRLYTARHVAVHEWIFERRGVACVWDAGGVAGSAWMEDYDLRRDLAVMRSDRPFPRAYARASSAPQPGDEVRISGYDFGHRQDPLRPREVTVKVLSVVAGHVALSPGGRRGFSGSCVLDGRDEVVGIFHWIATPEGVEFGVASLVVGEWGDVSWMPPREGKP